MTHLLSHAFGVWSALAIAASAASAGPGPDGWAAFEAQRFDEAVRVWRGPAERGDALAEFGLGVAYDLGHGVPADPLEACAWYRRAGEAGLAAAAFNVAIMYDNARCGPRQADAAAIWYAEAAARGHARAQYNVAQLYAAGDGVPRNQDQAAVWFRAAAASGVAAAADRLQAAPTRTPPTSAVLAPASPAVPMGVVHADPSDMDVTVAFVWTAPAEGMPTRFIVEVYALDDAAPHEIFSRAVDQSATVVPLPSAAARYAWRVLTVGTGSQHYATSPWLGFRTVPGYQP